MSMSTIALIRRLAFSQKSIVLIFHDRSVLVKWKLLRNGKDTFWSPISLSIIKSSILFLRQDATSWTIFVPCSKKCGSRFFTRLLSHGKIPTNHELSCVQAAKASLRNRFCHPQHWNWKEWQPSSRNQHPFEERWKRAIPGLA